MKHITSLIGRRYGKLVVLERVLRESHTYWKCVCDCGREVITRNDKLIKGRVGCRSCSHLKDLSGKAFGEWTVLSFRGNSNNKHIYWMCQCSCGTIKEVSGTSLVSGLSTNCGCKQINDLTGQKFGHLLALERINEEPKKTKYRCVCACGLETVVAHDSLRSGNTKSCGCMMPLWCREAHIIHGHSHTKPYEAWLSRKRRENIRSYDTEWTLNMELFLRDLFPHCVACGSSEQLAVDHLLPLEMGYGLSVDNAVILCRSCNSRKHTTYIAELSKESRVKILQASQKFQDEYYKAVGWC